jgi:hypothetical protein
LSQQNDTTGQRLRVCELVPHKMLGVRLDLVSVCVNSLQPPIERSCVIRDCNRQGVSATGAPTYRPCNVIPLPKTFTLVGLVHGFRGTEGVLKRAVVQAVDGMCEKYIYPFLNTPVLFCCK